MSTHSQLHPLEAVQRAVPSWFSLEQSAHLTFVFVPQGREGPLREFPGSALQTFLPYISS